MAVTPRGRLLCVSNRVMTAEQSQSSGGLAVALSELLSRREGLWIGWSGEVSEHRGVRDESVRHLTLDMSAEEHDGAYIGYANSVLWPVFHNRLDLARFDRDFFGSYIAYQARIARLIAAVVRPHDSIWIHDYHFLLLGRMLRNLGVTNPIGFFLHIPFPPLEAYLAVPEHRELSLSLASYDLIGFQTQRDVANVIASLRVSVAAELVPDGRIKVGDLRTSLGSFPIGIDADVFRTDANVPKGPLKRILGVDRLDYTKGLPQKFKGFAHLLRSHPEFRKTMVLTQIAAPTRESVEVYSDIRQELEGISGAINGEYGDVDWMPVHYIHRCVPRRRLSRLYRSSAIGFVTPLRDGMNLTAKEYVAAQDPGDPGVLVLSKFAGAAEELVQAVLVNPYCAEELGDALAAALGMPLGERRRRHAALLATVARRDTVVWAEEYLDHLARGSLQRQADSAATHAA